MMNIRRFQMGGEIPAEQAPVEQPMPEEGGGDPMQQIVEVIMQLAEASNQALQSQDPNAMSQVLQGLIQFASDLQAQLGGGQEQEVPTFKKGGKFLRMRKACK